MRARLCATANEQIQSQFDNSDAARAAVRGQRLRDVRTTMSGNATLVNNSDSLPPIDTHARLGGIVAFDRAVPGAVSMRAIGFAGQLEPTLFADIHLVDYLQFFKTPSVHAFSQSVGAVLQWRREVMIIFQ